jgi:hypothetical protein
MSLLPRHEKEKKHPEESAEATPESGQRPSQYYKDAYEDKAIGGLINQAAYKESIGMELSPEERFIVDNKGFFLRKMKRKPSNDEGLK